MPDNSIKRLTSHKISIRDILEGEYIKVEGWDPSYVLTSKGKRVSRINIMATIVSKEANALRIDDGDSTISLRFFDDAKMASGLDVGGNVMVVGKIRKYGEEVYIVPEIIKKIDNIDWLRVRKLELHRQIIEENEYVSRADHDHLATQDIKKGIVSEHKTGERIGGRKEDENQKKGENISLESEKAELPESSLSPVQTVLKLIEENDAGKGADTDIIMTMAKEKFNVNQADCEKAMRKLLEEGEIFEIKPGKLKILE